MMKLGYSTWGMPEVSISQAIPRVAAMGYTGLELAVLDRFTTRLDALGPNERRLIRGLLADHQLELPAIAAHSPVVGIDDTEYGRSLWRLRGAVELALDLAPDRPPAINTTTGGKPEDWEGLKDLLVDRVAELAEYAGARGVCVAMEPHVGAAIDRPEKMLWLIERVDSAYLKVNCDYSHFQAQGLSVEESVPQLVPHTVHAHVKGALGRAPDFQFVTPGEDRYDYAHYLRVMAEAGYAGFQTVEISVHVQRRPGYDPFAHAQLAFDTLSRAFAECDLHA